MRSLGRNRLRMGALALTLVMAACSGGGGGGSTPLNPTADGEIHAAAVAGYQAMGAGTSYPLQTLQSVSPTGSTIRTLLAAGSAPLAQGARALTLGSPQVMPALTYMPTMNLYAGSAGFNGNTFTIHFYTDAAGLNSAGSVSATLPTALTNPADPTSYQTYPAVIPVTLDITGGNVPCTGNLQISFDRATGANTMTGTNTLTRTNVVFTLALTLDDSMNAGGTITVTEGSATVHLTSVHGNPLQALYANVSIDPYGWTGTGTLNLLTGAMTVDLNTGTGTSSVSADSAGNLDIAYADGSSEIVYNALAAGLTATTGTIAATAGTPQNAAAGTAFSAPLQVTVEDSGGKPVSGATVTFTAPASGASGTFAGGVATATTNAAGVATSGVFTANGTAGSYTVTGTVAGMAAPGPADFAMTNLASNGYQAPLVYTSAQRTITAINNLGASIGYVGTTHLPVYWASPTAQGQAIPVPSGDTYVVATSLNDSGQIVGYGGASASAAPIPFYWASPAVQPQPLALPSGHETSPAYPQSIASNGKITGWVDEGPGQGGELNEPLYWSGPAAQPLVLDVAAPSLGATPGLILAGGQILCTNGWSPNFAWAGPASPAVLPKPLVVDSDHYPAPSSENASGLIVGASFQGSFPTAVTWAGSAATPQVLPFLALADLVPGAMTTGFAYSINTAGTIAGTLSGWINPGSNEQAFTHAVIWQGGVAKDLNDLIPTGGSVTLKSATLITDQGVILGTGTTSGGTAVQFVLVPD